VTGNLGLSPGTAVTGFPPGTLNGTQQVANAISLQAKSDLNTAYGNAAGQTTTALVSSELGGTTKTPGVYGSASGSFAVTGNLTLDAQNNPNAVFIFKTYTTLTTAGASKIILVNGAQACNVFWQVGSSATLGIGSSFKGNILAQTSATLTTGANVEGRVLASGGAVTLDTNTISMPSCSVVVTPPTVPSTSSGASSAGTSVTPPTAPSTSSGASSAGVSSATPIPTSSPSPTVTPVVASTVISSSGSSANNTTYNQNQTASVQASVPTQPYVSPMTFPNTGIAPSDGHVSFNAFIAGLFKKITHAIANLF
jgi:hypothetical protein